MTEGAALQLDIAGPWTAFTKSKQYAGQLRGVNRTKTKIWLLLAIDCYASRLKCAALEDLTSGSVSAAIQEIVSSTGWNTKKISIDPRLSLVTGVEGTGVDVAAHQDQNNEHQDTLQGQVDDYGGQAAQVIRNHREQGFEVNKPYAKNSCKQVKIESMIKTF